MNDYFTRAEFRTFVKDVEGIRYGDDDIDRAQAEVIERIEEWANSAWPNVTGVDGDGTAEVARTATEYPDVARGFVTDHEPIIEVTTLTIGETEISADSYVIDKPAGIFTFAGKPRANPGEIEVVFTYGFTSCPWSVKRPAMMAAKTLLDQEEGRGGLPANASRIDTEGTSIELLVDNDALDDMAFPWDPIASRALAAYWNKTPVAGAV